MKCENCKFFFRFPESSALKNKGQCRRYPPVVEKVDDISYQSKFPIICDDDWCGEFKHK